MVRSEKDYGYIPPAQPVVLRPPLTFHTGKVIYYDHFDHPFLSWRGGGASGVELSVSTDYAFSGDSSLKITPGTISTYYGYAQKFLMIPDTQKIGIEFRFAFNSAKTEYFDLELTANLGGEEWQYKVRYDHVNKKLQYYTNGGAYADITDGNLPLYYLSGCFHAMKLTVDLEKHKYNQLYVNQHVYDLSSYGGFDYGDYAYDFIAVNLRYEVSDGTQPSAYVDEFAILSEDW